MRGINAGSRIPDRDTFQDEDAWQIIFSGHAQENGGPQPNATATATTLWHACLATGHLFGDDERLAGKRAKHLRTGGFSCDVDQLAIAPIRAPHQPHLAGNPLCHGQ